MTLKFSAELAEDGRSCFGSFELKSGLRGNLKLERIKARDRTVQFTATLGGFGNLDPVSVFNAGLAELQDLVARGQHAKMMNVPPWTAPETPGRGKRSAVGAEARTVADVRRVRTSKKPATTRAR